MVDVPRPILGHSSSLNQIELLEDTHPWYLATHGPASLQLLVLLLSIPIQTTDR